jgi:CheY-like chemotaxis protein
MLIMGLTYIPFYYIYKYFELRTDKINSDIVLSALNRTGVLSKQIDAGENTIDAWCLSLNRRNENHKNLIVDISIPEVLEKSINNAYRYLEKEGASEQEIFKLIGDPYKYRNEWWASNTYKKLERAERIYKAETNPIKERLIQLAKDLERRIKVLAIDDQAGVLEAIKEILKIADIDVITALDGEEGLKLLTSDFDMVFTGFKQPGMNGIDILKAVKERFPFMPVAIISAAYASEANAITLGAYELLRKPFLMREILSLAEKGFKLRHAANDSSVKG